MADFRTIFPNIRTKISRRKLFFIDEERKSVSAVKKSFDEGLIPTLKQPIATRICCLSLKIAAQGSGIS